MSVADFGADVLGVLGAVAPALATAVGGPFAGLAVQKIGQALGLPQTATAATVAAAVAVAGPDELLALKKADNDFTLAMRSLDIDLDRLSQSDASSARAREIAVHDWTPSILAYCLTAGFFGLLALMIFHGLPEENAPALNILLGALGTGWIQSIGYYFGSTYGSKTKDAMLFQSIPAASAVAPAGRLLR